MILSAPWYSTFRVANGQFLSTSLSDSLVHTTPSFDSLGSQWMVTSCQGEPKIDLSNTGTVIRVQNLQTGKFLTNEDGILMMNDEGTIHITCYVHSTSEKEVPLSFCEGQDVLFVDPSRQLRSFCAMRILEQQKMIQEGVPVTLKKRLKEWLKTQKQLKREERQSQKELKKINGQSSKRFRSIEDQERKEAKMIRKRAMQTIKAEHRLEKAKLHEYCRSLEAQSMSPKQKKMMWKQKKQEFKQAKKEALNSLMLMHDASSSSSSTSSSSSSDSSSEEEIQLRKTVAALTINDVVTMDDSPCSSGVATIQHTIPTVQVSCSSSPSEGIRPLEVTVNGHRFPPHRLGLSMDSNGRQVSIQREDSGGISITIC